MSDFFLQNDTCVFVVDTCMQLLVNELQPEGYWRLDESFAEALDLSLDDLIRSSPIVALPIPKECNCAKDITIMVEDLTGRHYDPG